MGEKKQIELPLLKPIELPPLILPTSICKTKTENKKGTNFLDLLDHIYPISTLDTIPNNLKEKLPEASIMNRNDSVESESDESEPIPYLHGIRNKEDSN